MPESKNWEPRSSIIVRSRLELWSQWFCCKDDVLIWTLYVHFCEGNLFWFYFTTKLYFQNWKLYVHMIFWHSFDRIKGYIVLVNMVKMQFAYEADKMCQVSFSFHNWSSTSIVTFQLAYVRLTMYRKNWSWKWKLIAKYFVDSHGNYWTQAYCRRVVLQTLT